MEICPPLGLRLPFSLALALVTQRAGIGRPIRARVFPGRVERKGIRSAQERAETDGEDDDNTEQRKNSKPSVTAARASSITSQALGSQCCLPFEIGPAICPGTPLLMPGSRIVLQRSANCNKL